MALFISVKIIAQAGRQAFVLDKSGILKCYLVAPAVDGKANKALIGFIADVLRIPKKSIEIVSGLISPRKRIAIDTDMTYEQFLQAVGCPVQGQLVK